MTSTVKYSAQPTFQRRINVVSTLWINFEITLIRRWKWSKIQRRIFNVAQLWYNVSVRRRSNVETTLNNVGIMLIQRCFNLASTLVKPILNPIGLVMIVDCVIEILVIIRMSLIIFYSKFPCVCHMNKLKTILRDFVEGGIGTGRKCYFVTCMVIYGR